ncbi:MAG: molybdenum cofactor biosynthesis protein MoaE [Alphaproteobacteria bacterium]|nr:molybdenum cofactor biosynthesis protein MoaE [Alphaproteobacteria bacterium]
MNRIRVQPDDFDPGLEIAQLGAQAGAVVSFVGLVRAENSGDRLISMTLEHFPGMTERELERIANEARARWELLGVTIVHRYGELKPSERIVLVVTAASHRRAAFEAAEYLMDYLKTSAPFWKQELRQSGAYWIEARSSDDDAAARWSKG